MPECGETLLRAEGISKAFPGVQALAEVGFDLRAGEVHALIGENGAGKSTLSRILAGIANADGGGMRFCGEPYAPASRGEAEAQGVRMVMQELNLIPTLSVAENIFLGSIPSRAGFIRYEKLHADAHGALARVGLQGVDVAAPVASLGVGQQQLVEIAAALWRPFRVLILDEPTASLASSEVDLLFSQVQRLKNEGAGIVYISHRMEEVLHIADRVTVLRDGRLVGTRRAEELNHDTLIQMMVGRDIEHAELAPPGPRGPLALRVRGLRRGAQVRDVSFDAYSGEILGVAGLMGAGRTETMRAIFGADRAEAGAVYLHGAEQPARIKTPRDAVRQGVALLTEDRKEQGLLLPLPVRVNVTATHLRAVSRLGWIQPEREQRAAREHTKALNVRCASVEQVVRELSGGNQQKVVLAKWLHRDCGILICDEPTRGIDVGAKFEIYRLLGELARKGKAIIFVSSDLMELMAISNRILVLSAGRVAGEFARGEWTEESLLAAAFSGYTGSERSTAAV